MSLRCLTFLWYPLMNILKTRPSRNRCILWEKLSHLSRELLEVSGNSKMGHRRIPAVFSSTFARSMQGYWFAFEFCRRRLVDVWVCHTIVVDIRPAFVWSCEECHSVMIWFASEFYCRPQPLPSVRHVTLEWMQGTSGWSHLWPVGRLLCMILRYLCNWDRHHLLM